MNFKGIDILIKEKFSTEVLIKVFSEIFMLKTSDIEIVSSYEKVIGASKLSCIMINRFGIYAQLLKVDGNIYLEKYDNIIDLIKDISTLLKTKILISKNGDNPFLYFQINGVEVKEISFDEESVNPEKEIDGAKVIEWAWSGTKPFGFIPIKGTENQIEIYGFAICKYENSDEYYRFSCDQNWNVENDMNYCSLSDAKENIPLQYNVENIKWEKA